MPTRRDLLVAALALLLLPPVLSALGLGITSATEVVIFAIACMALNILVGTTGLTSFGHGAWFGLGAYAAAMAQRSLFPGSFVTPMAIGLGAVLALAAVFGFLILRRRGVYFSLLTLALSAMLYSVAFRWTEVTGGENGLTFSQPRLSILGLWSDRFTPTTFHWFVLAVVVLSYLLVRRITQSPFGMVLQSIRENEPRTRAIGYHVERYKIVAVMLSGLFAGLAGVLYAMQNKFAAPDFVFFLVSGEVVIFNVMGGVGTLVGPIAGAAFFLLLREGLSRYFEYYLIPVGIIFTLMVIFLPQGFLGFLRRRLNQ